MTLLHVAYGTEVEDDFSLSRLVLVLPLPNEPEEPGQVLKMEEVSIPSFSLFCRKCVCATCWGRMKRRSCHVGSLVCDRVTNNLKDALVFLMAAQWVLKGVG